MEGIFIPKDGLQVVVEGSSQMNDDYISQSVRYFERQEGVSKCFIFIIGNLLTRVY